MNIMTVKLRPATRDEVEEVRLFMWECFKFNQTKKFVTQKIGEGRMWIAEVSDKKVGLAELTLHGNTLCVILLCIREEFRNRGYGSRVLEEIESLARILDKEYVCLEPLPERTKFYEERGYEAVKEGDELMLRKNIKKNQSMP